MFVFMALITLFVNAQKRMYILFEYDSTKAYLYMDSKTVEKNISGFFYLDKHQTDCPYAVFNFYKYSSDSSIIDIKVDTLENVVNSKWIRNQLDTTLIRLFDKKELYVIPKDSIKDGRSKAFLVTYRYCEKI